MIESHGEFPQPPANINLNHPGREDLAQLQQLQRVNSSGHGLSSGHTLSSGHALHGDGNVPTATMGLGQLSQLQAQASAAQAAQAVADLSEGRVKRQQEEAYMGQNKRFRTSDDDPSEELSRQLQADGLPRSSAL